MTIVADQSEAIEFLRAALTDAIGPPRVVTTHASIIFVGTGFAFKLKRAVKFPFLDFSTPERRLALCRREFLLNQRTAPNLYLDARRVTRGPDGALGFEGDGALVDAIVVMRRFEDADLLERREQAEDLPAPLMTRLAHAIASLHDAAAPAIQHGGAAAMRRVLEINEKAMAACDAFSQDDRDALAADLRDRHAALSGLLDARRDAGKTRRCHGDLTLRNICVFDGAPTLFDCLEFDEDLARIDVLYDLAFLLMDLWRRGRADAANLVFNHYLDERDETDGLPLMPFFMAVRACVRAHVVAAQAREAEAASAERAAALREDARAYFAFAQDCLGAKPAALVAIGGLSGSGKSTAAAAIAPMLGPLPGARVLSSDRIRKALHGVAPQTRLTPQAYRPEASRAVYAEQRKRARTTLAAGFAVVADAVFDRPDSRAAIEDVARQSGAPFRGFWLDAPIEALAARVAARRGDVSDATVAVLRAQAEIDPGEMTWTRLDASGEAEAVARALDREMASRLS